MSGGRCAGSSPSIGSPRRCGWSRSCTGATPATRTPPQASPGCCAPASRSWCRSSPTRRSPATRGTRSSCGCCGSWGCAPPWWWRCARAGGCWGPSRSCAPSRPRAIGQEELRLAEELARRAAVAVDNALLYREAQKAIGLRDGFLQVAAHELRTPVTALKLNAQALVASARREERLARAHRVAAGGAGARGGPAGRAGGRAAGCVAHHLGPAGAAAGGGGPGRAGARRWPSAAAPRPSGPAVPCACASPGRWWGGGTGCGWSRC